MMDLNEEYNGFFQYRFLPETDALGTIWGYCGGCKDLSTYQQNKVIKGSKASLGFLYTFRSLGGGNESIRWRLPPRDIP